MEISITKNHVYPYAMALTARAATTTDAYMQTTITEDNYPMLDVYLTEAVSAAEGEMRKKLAKSHPVDMTLKEEAVEIRTKEQWRAEPSVYGLIESGIRLFLAYYVASKWLKASPATGLADVYGATAATHLGTAIEALDQKADFRVDEADYSDRDSDRAAMNLREGSGSEYARRKRDDVLARPGACLPAHEILTVRDDDGGNLQEPAISANSEILISNQ